MSMTFPQNFNKALFTLEELQSLKKVISGGDLKYLTGVLASGGMTPEKELELQKLKTSLEPSFAGFENKVKESLQKLAGKNIVIESPEQEVEVQKLIDSEQSVIREKNNLIQKKNELAMMLGEDKVEATRIKGLIEDINKSVEELDKKYKKDFTLKIVEKILKPEKEKVEEVEKEEIEEEIEEPKKDGEKEDDIANTPEDEVEAEKPQDNTEESESCREEQEVEDVSEEDESVITAEPSEKEIEDMDREAIKNTLDDLEVEFDGRTSTEGLKEILKSKL